MRPNTSPSSAPIAVLDSGLGGLTVVRAIRKALPHEDILYFADTARAPYGRKTAAVVVSFVRQMVTYLLPMEPKHVVIACNTTTALTLSAMKREFPGLSISGVIQPGAKAAAVAAGSKHFPVIGVIGSEATIASKAYERAVARLRNHARMFSRSAPLLVPAIEEGRGHEDPLLIHLLQHYLAPLMDRGLEVLVLGCAHYPLVKPIITRIVGPAVQIIDSADECAEDVTRRLLAAGLLNGGAIGGGRLQSFVTDLPTKLEAMAVRFFGSHVGRPHWVAPDDLNQLGTGIEGFDGGENGSEDDGEEDLLDTGSGTARR